MAQVYKKIKSGSEFWENIVSVGRRERERESQAADDGSHQLPVFTLVEVDCRGREVDADIEVEVGVEVELGHHHHHLAGCLKPVFADGGTMPSFCFLTPFHPNPP